MLSSYLTMQSAILAGNVAITNMMSAANRTVNPVSFGNSLPLRPFLMTPCYDELCIKRNETKVSVMKNIYNAISKKLGKDIAKSTPKYAGIDYKA